MSRALALVQDGYRLRLLVWMMDTMVVWICESFRGQSEGDLEVGYISRHLCRTGKFKRLTFQTGENKNGIISSYLSLILVI